MAADKVDLDVLLILPYGLYIVSSKDDEKHNGHISNSVVQVTDSPPRLAITVSKKNLTYDYIRNSGVVGVSVLDQKTPFKFIGRFGFKSGRDIDKFADTAYTIGPTGCPLITQHALAVIEAKVINEVDVGSHAIFVGEITWSQFVRTGEPMTYAYYRETLRGKTPPNAPSYQGRARAATEQPKHHVEGDDPMQKYECTVCGYVYDPAAGDPDNNVEPGTPFENLPDDWVCPECGAEKSEFEPLGE